MPIKNPQNTIIIDVVLFVELIGKEVEFSILGINDFSYRSVGMASGLNRNLFIAHWITLNVEFIGDFKPKTEFKPHISIACAGILVQ
eukprot:TRINITY_DN3902_c0_g1_i2.p2 TRINITY_DN3902_c0_g1~~TRINITY_DN3902_c0_g1_i2.p2  ORF type:complete len:87 (-),score=4.44 TRINITY_DN3902_c0_g1_i2:66-326(-)